MRFAATVFLVAWMCGAWPVAGADTPLVVEIWPGTVPDESGNIGEKRFRMSPKLDRKQVEVTEPTRMITDVTKPTLTIYQPAKDKNTGTAMLICPGDGYWNLSRGKASGATGKVELVCRPFDGIPPTY